MARNNQLQVFRSAHATYDQDTDPSGLKYGEFGWNNGGTKLFIGKQTTAGTPGTVVKFQINPAASATVAGLVELATIAETNTGTDAARAVTPDALNDWQGNTSITSVGDIDVGTWSGDNIGAAYLPDASTTAEGVVELATSAETNTGTDTGRVVTPAGLTAWTGDTALVTVGTIATGVWSGTALVAGKVPKLNGITQPDGDMNFNGQTLTNIDEPTADTDAATKGYVDAKAQGLDVKESVRMATAADLPACTYAQPVATTGVGATLTANANGALTVDGVAVAINDRVLVQHQGAGTETHAHNGIYRVSTLGTGSAAWVLTRAVDFDENDEISAAAFVFVEAGTANPDSGFVCTTDGAITFSSSTFSGVGWTQFSGAGQVLAGTGLTKSGNTLNAIGTSNRISVSADAINIHTSYVGQSSITTLGTIATGVWTGTSIAVANGGTGATTFASNGVLYGAGTSAVGATAAGANNALLYSNSGTPAWTTSPDALTIDCGTF